MNGSIEGAERSQATPFPERPDDDVAEDSAVRVIDELDLTELGFRTATTVTGRPAYHPAPMLKLYTLRLKMGRPYPGTSLRFAISLFLVGRMPH